MRNFTPGILPSLVAIHGMKRSGKGTIAERLVLEHGYTQGKFAGALKDMTRVVLRQVCHLSDADIERCIEGDLKEAPIPAIGGKSARFLMQRLGTEWRDTVDTAMWSRMALLSIRAVISRGGRVVVDDLRFGHEYGLLAPEGAEFWLVESSRPGPLSEVDPAIPWDPGSPISLDIGEDHLRAMVSAMLAHCGLPSDLALSPDSSIALEALAGRSPADCLESLRTVWLPLMAAPWSPGPASTAGHISEQGLPREWFSRHFRNDGSIHELHAVVDGVMGLQAAA